MSATDGRRATSGFEGNHARTPEFPDRPEPAADGDGPGLGAAVSHPRRVFGELARGGAGAAGAGTVALAAGLAGIDAGHRLAVPGAADPGRLRVPAGAVPAVDDHLGA